jgi:hypothetical protein
VPDEVITVNDFPIHETVNTSNNTLNLQNTTNNNSAVLNDSSQCTDVLRLFISKTVANSGDVLMITMLSPTYAEVQAESAEGNVLLFDDNLERNVYAVSVPETTRMKITAQAKLCDSIQRMTRTVIVKKSPELVGKNTSQVLLSKDLAIDGSRIDSSDADSVAEKYVERNNSESVQNTSPVASLSPVVNDQVTIPSEVVYDKNLNVLPWIALFGIITMLCCTIIFFVLYRKGEI